MIFLFPDSAKSQRSERVISLNKETLLFTYNDLYKIYHAFDNTRVNKYHTPLLLLTSLIIFIELIDALSMILYTLCKCEFCSGL